jgi:hypothetical protein
MVRMVSSHSFIESTPHEKKGVTTVGLGSLSSAMMVTFPNERVPLLEYGNSSH